MRGRGRSPVAGRERLLRSSTGTGGRCEFGKVDPRSAGSGRAGRVFMAVSSCLSGEMRGKAGGTHGGQSSAAGCRGTPCVRRCCGNSEVSSGLQKERPRPALGSHLLLDELGSCDTLAGGQVRLRKPQQHLLDGLILEQASIAAVVGNEGVAVRHRDALRAP